MRTIADEIPRVANPAPSGLFCVIGGDGRIVAGTGLRVGTARTLGELRAGAGRFGGPWRHVWLTPAAVELYEMPARRRGWVEVDSMKVRAAQWENDSPFAGVEDPHDLYRALWELEAALGGVGWFQSGAVTSDVLLRALHRPPRARAISRTVLPPPAIKPQKGARAPGGEAPFMWHRAPNPAGDRGGWVHHYDLNGAYLAAASKLRLPQGEPIQLDPGAGVPVPLPPGYWRLELEPWDLPYPNPTGNRPRRDPELWVTSPTLRLLGDIEWPARVIDGWYWTDTCQALTPWYERLRDARRTLVGPGREAVKQIYRQGIGRLASDLRTNVDDPLYQPAWAHHVIAESRARIFRRIMQLATLPLAVEVDSIWVQHEAADPAEAAAAIRLPLGDELGQWKPLGRLEAGAAWSALSGPARGVFGRLRELEGGQG